MSETKTEQTRARDVMIMSVGDLKGSAVITCPCCAKRFVKKIAGSRNNNCITGVMTDPEQITISGKDGKITCL